MHQINHKSLKNRICFMVTLSTFFTVAIMSIIFLIFLNKIVFDIGTSTSKYYDQQIQSDVSRILEESNNKLVAKDFINNKLFQDDMERLSNMMPVFTVNMEMNREMVFDRDAESFWGNYFGVKSSKSLYNNESEFEKSNFNGTKVTKVLKDNKGNAIGLIRVGIDNKNKWLIYTGILFALIFGGIIVIVFMKYVTASFIKPILRPLSKLQKQMEGLADENYDNVNPTLIVDIKTVQEVYDLVDVTNRLLNKMVHYNEIITQSEKMASVGQLTAAITHEINTPLGAINSNVNMIKLMADKVSTIEDMKAIFEMNKNIRQAAVLSEEACARIKQIVRSLRSFSRIDQSQFMKDDINESIRSVITLTSNLHKNSIDINEKLAKLPKVSCYIGLINQVFMNIIINSIEAIDGKGSIEIETSSDGTYVYAKICDTGCGISNKNIHRIFEYGFTTKQLGFGSGIGLALSKNIVNKHNGVILVDSQEKKGTTITVKIPINQEKIE